MQNEYFSFNPGTVTCRSPIPSKFEHFLKFITKEENFLGLHSQEDITNINNQLDQTLNLMVSNIIQRVIAQVIGQTPTGFITIQATGEGSLYVSVREDPDSRKVPLHAKIDIATTATHDIIAGVPGKSHRITAIMFTVGGEVNITLRDETGPFTGAMNFGAATEPNGMTHNHELIPLVCTVGEAFQITLSTDIQVSGYCTYYDA